MTPAQLVTFAALHETGNSRDEIVLLVPADHPPAQNTCGVSQAAAAAWPVITRLAGSFLYRAKDEPTTEAAPQLYLPPPHKSPDKRQL